MKSEKSAAFTLIELLVVVLIIGILAAIAVPQYQKAVLRSRYVQAQVITKNFADAADRYHLANGSYPKYWRDMDIGVPAGWKAGDEEQRGAMSGNGIYCDLMVGYEENILCMVSPAATKRSWKVGYLQFFSAAGSARECWAVNNDEEARAFCRGLGGKESGTSAHKICGESGCTRYTLP